MTTNTMEGIANANKHNHVRNTSPPESLRQIIDFSINQQILLFKNLQKSTSDGGKQYITGIAQNIMETIVRYKSDDRASEVVQHSIKRLADDEAKLFGLNDSTNLNKLTVEIIQKRKLFFGCGI